MCITSISEGGDTESEIHRVVIRKTRSYFVNWQYQKGKIDGFIIKTDQFFSTLKILPKHLYFRSKF